jgi:hypothetical protein
MPRRRSRGRSGITHRVEEDHEVGQEDFVELTERAEGVQLVLDGHPLAVRGLPGELGAERVQALASVLEHA